MLEFNSVGLEFKNIADSYYNKYGERSCQHSFATSFCLKNKYNDMFVEKDGVLYICREGISDDNERVYLFPMCDKSNKDLIINAINNVLNDAHLRKKKAVFKTITKSSKDILTKFFPDIFMIEDSRDLYEYIYDVKKIATLQGSLFQSKRNIINKFYKTYSEVIVKEIDKTSVHELKKVYEEWLYNRQNLNQSLINNEIKEFEIAIDNYDKLGLIGLSVYVDNVIVGFNFGALVSGDTYDGMVQKGNIKYEGIYEILNRETAKMYQNLIRYMNFEEDLGVEGLRKAKLMYHPDYMIEKYIAKEK
jgi:hypothetical protein